VPAHEPAAAASSTQVSSTDTNTTGV
jgi:hypothetical protein